MEHHFEDYNYDLPPERIAQSPLPERDESRLLLLDKESGDISHQRFYNIVNYIDKKDCLILNDTRVLPARLFGKKKYSGGKIEFLLLNRKEGDVWEVMLKPGRRAGIGSEFIFGDGELTAEITGVVEGGNRLVKFSYDGVFEQIMDSLGNVPLPPYITQKLEDSERYQTVYAKVDGSAAAPTAGLHFTERLLAEIRAKGVKTGFITLHVGLGTFRPVKAQDPREHKMHSEYYNVSDEIIDLIYSTKMNGGRVIAVGTTAARALETIANTDGGLHQSGWTDIFIYPPYKFKLVDALVTNFHLPQSTLLMLVSAFAGKENIFKAYQAAIQNDYRFYSFGDAMFIY